MCVCACHTSEGKYLCGRTIFLARYPSSQSVIAAPMKIAVTALGAHVTSWMRNRAARMGMATTRPRVRMVGRVKMVEGSEDVEGGLLGSPRAAASLLLLEDAKHRPLLRGV